MSLPFQVCFQSAVCDRNFKVAQDHLFLTETDGIEMFSFII